MRPERTESSDQQVAELKRNSDEENSFNELKLQEAENVREKRAIPARLAIGQSLRTTRLDMKTTIPLFTIAAALLCATTATAQKKPKTPQVPQTLSVPDQALDLPGGRITFKQLTIVKCGQFMPEEFLQGIVTNGSEHTWEYLSIEAKAKTQRGTDYPNRLHFDERLSPRPVCEARVTGMRAFASHVAARFGQLGFFPFHGKSKDRFHRDLG